MIKEVERARTAGTRGQNLTKERLTNSRSTFRSSTTRSTTKFEGRLIDTTSKLGLCIPNREPFYSWRSWKWNLQNATQKPAQSNTLIACTRTHVVYEITCELCGECYVGSTVRALHDRAREHIASAKNQTKASAMGVHYKNAYKNLKSNPKLRFRIVCATEKNELRWRIEEALAIRTRKPTLNRRGEETGIDFLTWTCSPALANHRLLPSTTLTISDIKPARTPEQTKSINPKFSSLQLVPYRSTDDEVV